MKPITQIWVWGGWGVLMPPPSLLSPPSLPLIYTCHVQLALALYRVFVVLAAVLHVSLVVYCAMESYVNIIIAFLCLQLTCTDIQTTQNS